MDRKGYPSDVTDEEWAFVAPYLTLMKEEAAATSLQPARSIQWLALDHPRRRPVAVHAQRPASVGDGLSAKSAVD